MEEEARKRISLATVTPIMGLLLAGIVGVIAASEINRGVSGDDRTMVSAFVVLLVASIFGGSNLIASRLLVQASTFVSATTGQPLQQVSGVKTFVFVMHNVWVAINGLFWFIFSTTLNLSFSNSSLRSGDGVLRSDFNPLTVVPIVLIAVSLVGLQLLVMDARARTATAPRPIWHQVAPQQ